MFSNSEEVLKFISDEKVEYLDVRFCDLPGVMQHLTVPASTAADILEDGVAFDGSSVRGFQAINESDMALFADSATAYLDPFRKHKTLNINFFVHDPITGEPYSRDPRNVARKAEEYLAASGVADTVLLRRRGRVLHLRLGAVRAPTHTSPTTTSTPSRAGGTPGARKRAATSATRSPTRAATSRCPPVDHYADLRDDMVSNMIQAGFEVERGHHEVGTAGQAEINYKFNTLLHAADDIMLFKYIVKNTAWAAGKTATFMPKPLFGDNGSGMHAHQSLWKDGQPLFHDEAGYGGLSDLARYYIGGILHHAPSLLAFTNPTVNSYHRLVPGFEAPVNLVYSARNRSACIRIPITGNNPKAKRLEFRCPDSSGNPYLAFAAMMMAGMDGIKNKIEPPAPVDKDLYELPPEEAKDIAQVPASLPAVIDRLEADHEYLLEGGVFTPDLIETWIDLKRTLEIDPLRLRPHPYEFALYYDV